MSELSFIAKRAFNELVKSNRRERQLYEALQAIARGKQSLASAELVEYMQQIARAALAPQPPATQADEPWCTHVASTPETHTLDGVPIPAKAEEVKLEPGWLQRDMRMAAARIEPPATQAEGRRVRHKKRGSTYRVIGKARIQSAAPLPDMAEVVIYQSERDGEFWARDPFEFNDGRFEELPASPQPPASSRDGEMREAMFSKVRERLVEAARLADGYPGKGMVAEIVLAIAQLDAALARDGADGEAK